MGTQQSSNKAWNLLSIQKIKKRRTTSGGLSQDFAGSGQNRVTAKNHVRAGSSHSAACNITVAKFN